MLGQRRQRRVDLLTELGVDEFELVGLLQDELADAADRQQADPMLGDGAAVAGQGGVLGRHGDDPAADLARARDPDLRAA